MIRTWVLRLHIATALAAGPWIVIQGLTGSVVSFREELKMKFYPELYRVEPQATRVSLQSIVDGLRRAFPRDRLDDIVLSRGPDRSYEAYFNGEDDRRAYVDPYTGRIIASRHVKSPMLTIEAIYFWHKTLLWGKIGRRINLAVGSLFFLHCFTGLFLWWPRRRTFIAAALRPQPATRWSPTRLLAWHRLVGFCFSLHLAIISLFGVEILYHTLYARPLLPLFKLPKLLERGKVERPAGREPLPLDRLLELAVAAQPGAAVTTVELPQTPEQALYVCTETPEEAGLYHDGRSRVLLNPYTGAVLALYDNARAPWRYRWYNTAFLVHSGRWGGWPSRVLQAAAGLVPLTLFVLGIGALIQERRAGKAAEAP